jgi:hypothetical protein
MRAMVGKEQRFMSNDPSPSRAITLRCGKPKAIPKAMDEQSPRVLTRKLPSLGLRAFHSSVVAPAELTIRASPASAANAFKQSNRFICLDLLPRNLRFALILRKGRPAGRPYTLVCRLLKKDLRGAPCAGLHNTPAAVLRPKTSFVSSNATGRFESSARICARLMTSLT